jgi:8-oxo-dGTP diphosphatase
MALAPARPIADEQRLDFRAGMAMTTIDRAVRPRRLYFSPSGSDFHDPAAPAATAVIPTVVVAVRWLGGRRLIVRRYDSGC